MKLHNDRKHRILSIVLCLLMAAEALASPVRVSSFDAAIEVLGNGDIVSRSQNWE